MIIVLTISTYHSCFMSEQLNIPMYMCASIKLQIDVTWQAVDVPMNHYVPYNVNPKNRYCGVIFINTTRAAEATFDRSGQGYGC